MACKIIIGRLKEYGYKIVGSKEFYDFFNDLISHGNETEKIISEYAINNMKKIRKEMNMDIGVFIIPV